MKNKILITIGILVLALNLNLVLAEDYYRINFNYNSPSEVLNLNSVNLESSGEEISFYEREFFGYPNYEIKILDKDDNVLDLGIFYTCDGYRYDIADSETFGKIVDGGDDCTDRASIEVNVPYYENAEYIAIYNPSGNEIIKYSIVSGSLASIKKPWVFDNKVLVSLLIAVFFVFIFVLLFNWKKIKKKLRQIIK